MSQRVYQILYCSRNTIQGTAQERRMEVERILRASRVNNGRLGVTGALFYNTVFFAQVLEGSFADVQRIFERLQLDPRHSDLVVLQSGFVGRRDFEDWSMAFAGASAEVELPLLPHGVTSHSQNGNRVIAFLREVVIKQETWALPERRSAVRVTSERPAMVSVAG
jgi:blue light- and temperature-responsive anti-repressor